MSKFKIKFIFNFILSINVMHSIRSMNEICKLILHSHTNKCYRLKN